MGLMIVSLVMSDSDERELSKTEDAAEGEDDFNKIINKKI